MDLTVATYNIAAGLSNGYFRKKDYYKAAEVIKSINADIIALNEVGKALPKHIEDHTAFLASYCEYKYFGFAKATSFGAYPYGNAILSKFPIDNLTVTPIKKFIHIAPGIYEPRCIFTVEVLCENKNIIRVICTHFGLFPDEQRLGLNKVIDEIKNSKTPTIFMGDLNISKNNRVINSIRNLLTDVCVKSNKSVNTFPAKKPRKRLDYIFVSDNIEVIDVHTVKVVASDHLPLVAKISL